jgi:omega-6 fatty acid desaturase (delta-12 desaturase)
MLTLLTLPPPAFCPSSAGALRVFYFYGIPYLITNNNLVLITFLQHTDVFMPHFRAKEWNWLRGALCTVDRNFGFFMNRALHHITDTHVCHHLFSKMPFYHAEEATVHIKRVLGAYYLKDDTPITLALYRAYSCCQFVEDEGDVVFYKNIK